MTTHRNTYPNTKRVRKATYVATLVYVDEPQLVLLALDSRARIIAVAINDPDGSAFPFLGAQIHEDQFQRYIDGFVDLHFLFRYPRYKRWYKFDLAESTDDQVNLFPVMRSEIRDDSIPAPGFFSRDHTEEYSAQTIELAKQNFLIDGSWDLRDFSRFYGKYSDIYSFLLSLEKCRSQFVGGKIKRKIVDAFNEYPWRGGGSYLNFYGDLSRTQQSDDRLSVGSIQYASPGHVEIKGKGDVFRMIGFAIGNYESNQEEIYENYKSLYEYLRKSKLLRASTERFDDSGPVADYIFQEAKTLANKLRIQYFDEIYKMADKNSLAAAKIVLSYCRRLDGMYLFFAEGRVSFGDLKDA